MTSKWRRGSMSWRARYLNDREANEPIVADLIERTATGLAHRALISRECRIKYRAIVITRIFTSALLKKLIMELTI